jgi:hypothetical protein
LAFKPIDPTRSAGCHWVMTNTAMRILSIVPALRHIPAGEVLQARLDDGYSSADSTCHRGVSTLCADGNVAHKVRLSFAQLVVLSLFLVHRYAYETVVSVDLQTGCAARS